MAATTDCFCIASMFWRAGVAASRSSTRRHHGRRFAEFVEQGVRGLRLNLYSGVGNDTPLDVRFKAIEEPAHATNCHIEVIAPLKMLAENARLLARSRVPIVIDHYGIHAGHTPDDVEGRALLDLLSLPHVWIKLSAPYRNSSDDLATRPDPDWLCVHFGGCIRPLCLGQRLAAHAAAQCANG